MPAFTTMLIILRNDVGAALRSTRLSYLFISPAVTGKPAGLLITSELLKSRESDPRCFSLLLVSQHSIRRKPLEVHLWRTVGR